MEIRSKKGASCRRLHQSRKKKQRLVVPSHRMRLYFCKPILQRFYKDTNRARNPRFLWPLFGQKTGFRAHMNEIKSGIPCSGYKRTNPKTKATPRRVIACVCIFVNPSCKDFTKMQTHQSETKATHRRVIACVCIFVNPSCKYFTSIQTHQSGTKATHRRVIACVCIFVNPSCQDFTKMQTHQSETKATHRHVIACVCIL